MRADARPGMDLDGTWRFVRDTERRFVATSLPVGEPITVPGCWEAQVPAPYRIVTAWYHRTVEVPADWGETQLALSFGAVMYRCVVWLNGERIGDHEGGYTAFTIDVPHAVVRWGETNLLAVEVENPVNALDEYPAFAVERVMEAEALSPEIPLSEAPHGKQTWYSSQSGLWQSVRLERVGEARFDMLRIEPDVPGEAAVVRWRVGGADESAARRVQIVIMDPSGSEVARASARASAEHATVAIPDPVLWDLDDPRLYRLEARLSDDAGTEQDRVVRRFGMRTVGTDGGRVTLNGRPVYLLGVLDQDLYPDTISTPPSPGFLREQMRRVKELGFNLLRCHIKVPDPAYLDAADEAGILVWCELPNWSRFTVAAATRGRFTLERMVETLGHHPSIAIWTVINEDWGTRLRFERRDREWLRATAAWLKDLDPTRLVVDNSACETDETPNFHLRSDLADFHVYVGRDDPLTWRWKIADFAARPAWLWSPNGDAEPRGDEPLVLSEFGGWGLPRLDGMVAHHGGDPWWFETGRGYYRPAGLEQRFHAYGLDRLWPTIDDLADATQWLQFEGLQLQIAEMRRHGSISGYVVTELSDAYWEANGVLDPMRGPKVFHGRFPEINAPDVVGFIPTRGDIWSGDPIGGEAFLSSFAPSPASGGIISWTLDLGPAGTNQGEVPLDAWPRFGVASLGALEIETPDVTSPTDAWLTLRASDDHGMLRAQSRLRFAILPSRRGGTAALRVAVDDPLQIWNLAARLSALGHDEAGRDQADVVVAAELTRELVDHAEAGGHVLVLVRSESAVPEHLGARLHRPVRVHQRRLPHDGWPGQRSPWEGDWVSNFSWIRPQVFPGLPERELLDHPFAEVAPDHVLLGYDPAIHDDEVDAGMFVGWVHEPAALLWRFGQGAGSLTFTTFRLAPESGPIASTLLDALLGYARDPSDRLRAVEPAHA